MTSENFILIDGSYFIFYRYYALHAWWKLAKPDSDLSIPIENEEFVEKYRRDERTRSKLGLLSF